MFGRRKRTVEQLVEREDAGTHALVTMYLLLGLGGLAWGATTGPLWALQVGAGVVGLAITWCVVRSAVLSAGRALWLEQRKAQAQAETRP